MTKPPAHTASALADGPVRHGFFGRHGGVSAGIYDSLNCGFGSSDARDAVAENRDRIVNALGGGRLVTGHQVHSARVAAVTQAWEPAQSPQCDGLVTDRPGIVLGALSADCAPILFMEAQAGVIGAAHSGWKGAVTGIAEATVDAMVALGAAREAIVAAIGPCIGIDSYEVGAEFKANILALDGAAAEGFFVDGPRGRPHFDLGAYVQARLERCGVATVERLALDTAAAEAPFFSYRRSRHRGEADYGRELSVIALA